MATINQFPNLAASTYYHNPGPHDEVAAAISQAYQAYLRGEASPELARALSELDIEIGEAADWKAGPFDDDQAGSPQLREAEGRVARLWSND